ncbi:amidase [Mollisia scopiformis]|uniref:Amidase n=1 Tax=Mollisia scopiformis TaxID=149040 RepID=A0A194XA26_MOLSC|nr:amidase [Mollisia scopiformis]KUJ16989.1 amidase [Mollisia scopiformis]
MSEPAWKKVAEAKQEERVSKIPKEWIIPSHLLPSEEVRDVQDFPHTSGLFTAEELEITESTASIVVSKIASGEWTAVQVLLATSKRASIAQQLINCLTEIYFDEALSRAKSLDEYFKKEGKVVGPLHGLPISFKDQFNLKGVDTSVGYISWCNKPAAEDSTLVELLMKAGAVPFVKTNIPATLMMGESVNNVFGRTRNPRNRDLTTGGSSGGESALVTFRGSFIGIGTDIGGSIRHPHGRVSYQKVANTFLGQEAVRSCAGPMTRSVDDTRLFMKSLASTEPWLYDPQAVPVPWREELEKLPEKLCFGFGMGDGRVNPTPPLRRAMEMTKAALLAAGHEVIDFIPTEHIEAMEIISKMWSADGGEEFQRDTDASGEPLHPQLEAWLGHSAECKPMTVFETWQNQQRRTVLQMKWLERWQATKELTGTGRPIDGLIMPSTPFPAIRHDGGYPHHWGAISPLLDLTTGVFPVTKVDLEKDVVPNDWKPISDLDEKVTKYYGHPKNHENALVGLAVIARRLEEEKVVAMMGEITKCLGGK